MDLACTDCHAGLDGVDDFPHGPSGELTCTMCHDAEHEDLVASAHGDDPHAPDCADCHGAHFAEATEPASPLNPLNQPRTCLHCHADPAFAEEHELDCREETAVFEASVHYQELLAGNDMAPSCSTCHGAHDVLPLQDAEGPVTHAHVADLCGMCHSEILERYEHGIHGIELAAGNMDTPTCNNCHQEHAIRRPADPGSSVSPTHIAQTCSACHEDEGLAERYGLTPTKLRTYLGSYHGVANKFGETTVANCASCHGAHQILPSSDPASKVHPDNLVATCGSCHPQAGQNFATGKIHVDDTPEDNYWAWLIRRVYLVMIYGVIGTFVSFILVDLWWRFRRARAMERHGA